MRAGYFDDMAQNLRLASGLILFAFAATHFLNHAVGLVHIEAMLEVQQWRWVVTRSWLGSIILGGALVTHVSLALVKVANRMTLRLPPWELLQIALGLAIPLLLLPHIVDTRVASAFFGVQDNYLYELTRLWPSGAPAQSALLLLVWIHGCVGIHYWLRLNERYRRLQPFLLAFAIIIPVAGLAGFMVAGRAVTSTMAEGEMAARIREVTHWPSPQNEDRLATYRALVRLGFLALLLIAVAYMALRHFLMLAAPKILISYAGGPSIRTGAGPTLLEISRANGVALIAACGGRARCTTCLVRIDEGADGLPPPRSAEAAALKAMAAAADMRLACQLRPRSSLTVTRLVGASDTVVAAAAKEEPEAVGVERPLAVLAVAMSESLELLQGRLPYDVVFILNEFLTGIGTAVSEQQGRIDKFSADSLLAVFGERDGFDAGCRQALRAARAIGLAMDRLNEKLAAEIGRPIKAAIGIHAGKVVLGRLGHGKATELTAVGWVVGIAMQLRALAQRSGRQVVLSADAVRAAGLPTGAAQTIKLGPPGNEQAIEILALAHAKDLPVDTTTTI
jgi:adenylate cyclase